MRTARRCEAKYATLQRDFERYHYVIVGCRRWLLTSTCVRYKTKTGDSALPLKEENSPSNHHFAQSKPAEATEAREGPFIQLFSALRSGPIINPRPRLHHLQSPVHRVVLRVAHSNQQMFVLEKDRFDDPPPLINSRIKGKAEENVWFSCWITLPKALGSHQLHT